LLNVRGENFQCQEVGPHLVHGNATANAVWVSDRRGASADRVAGVGVSGHRVRVRGAEPAVVAACRCGWAQTLSTSRAADQAAEAHCFSVAPDLAVECGSDPGGHWWQPEVLS
jgi:hypothetical protein